MDVTRYEAAQTDGQRERTVVRRIYWTAFLMRFVLGMAAWLALRSTSVPFLEDARYYEELGAGIAADWLAGRQNVWLHTIAHSGTSAWGTAVVIACVYYVLDGVRAVPLLLAAYAALTAWAAPLTYRCARQLGTGPAVATRSAYLVALAPSFVFWAGALYKEGLIFIVLNLIVLHTLRLLEGWSWRSILALSLAFPALFALRFYLAPLAALAVVVGLLWGRRRGVVGGVPTLVLARQIAVVLVVIGGALALGFGGQVARMLPSGVSAALQRIALSRADLASTSSGFLRDLDVSDPSTALRFAPLGTLYFLALPFPWQFGSLRQSMAIPETAAWLCLYPFVVVGVLAGLRRNRQGTVLILGFTLAMCVFYGLFAGNIGTVYRMRAQVWLFWGIFAAWGLERVRSRLRAPAAAIPDASYANGRGALPALVARR